VDLYWIFYSHGSFYILKRTLLNHENSGINIINKNENIIIHDLYMDNNTNINRNINIKNNETLDDSYNRVKDLYKDVGFMGQYGGDVFLCLLYLSIPVFVFLYFKTTFLKLECP
jgi:hypothetical protein